MPSNEKRKYQQVIDYVEDQIGADVNRDLLEVAIGAQDVVPIEVETALKEALKSSDNDEIVVRLAGSDGSEIVEETLDTDVGTGDVALLTYLARALNTVGSDELVARVTDSSGNQIDPATSALENALKSNDEDELVARVTDSTGSEVDPATQALENALKANDTDELISRIADSAGTEIDPATQALEAALKSNDTDEFVSRLAGADGNEVQEVALDTAATATDVALVTYLARALNTIGNDELVSRLTDSTGSQIDPARKATHDTVYTSIDLNTATPTTVYSPTTEAEVDGIHLNHGGSTAELRLEVTDGTNTAVLQDPAAGDPIHYPEPIHINSDDSLQVVVEVVEGASLTETAVVSRSEL